MRQQRRNLLKAILVSPATWLATGGIVAAGAAYYCLQRRFALNAYSLESTEQFIKWGDLTMLFGFTSLLLLVIAVLSLPRRR